MTTRKYSSRSQQTTLTSAINAGATTIVVGSGTSLLGGATVTGTERFTVVIDPDTALEEIVDVSAVSTNTLTVIRGIEVAGVGQAHSAGAVVRHMAIGRDYRESNLHIEATGPYNDGTTTHDMHGIASGEGNVVGTLKTQTLTNKDLSSGTNTMPTSTVTLTGTQTLTNKTLTSPTITGTGAIAGTFTGNLTGNVSGTAGSVTGNAATATALQTARDFQLTGDVEASAVSFDGTGVVNLVTSIGTGTIVNADVNASAAIDKTKISGTAVTVSDTGTVTSTMIADNTIVNADINTSAGITYGKLSLNSSITSSDIVDGTIVDADINASAAIAMTKLATNPIPRANHTGTQLASTISDFDTQVRTSRLDQMAAPTASVAFNAQKITGLGTPTANTTDAATTAYVDTAVANLVNSAPGTLDTLGEIATAIQAGGSVFDAMVLKAGSTMTGALVLNADPAANLGAATKQYVDTVAGSATAAAASAASAAASFDSFDDRYLGTFASDPTLDNDGDALITGALYFNSLSGTMRAFDGTAFGSISSTAAIFRFKFIAAGGETSFTGTDALSQTLNYLAGKEQVYLNGILLVRTTDYTATNGTSITGLAALAASDILEIITFTAFNLATAIDNTIIDAKGDLLVGTAADTVGRLAVGTDGHFLKANSATATGLEFAPVDLAAVNDNYILALMGAI